MEVQVSSTRPWLVVGDDPRIRAAIPSCRARDGRLAVPHYPDQTTVMRNLGYDVPSPILHHYDWRGTLPFDTQKKTAAMLALSRRAYVLNSIGTGKTRSVLYTFDYLRKYNVAKSMLVVAPLSTLEITWMDEIFRFFTELDAVVIYGAASKRRKTLAESASIYLINHDGVGVVQKELLEKKFDVVVVDELSVYRNQRTVRWKALEPIVKDAPIAWGLTGSPTPQAPTDAYGQVRLITPNNVPKYFSRFRDRVMTKVSNFKWLPKEKANDVVFDAMQPAVRFTRDDTTELPPVSYVTRKVDLSDKQKRIYDALFQRFRADYAEGAITAANEGVRRSKLMQVCCGFAYTDTKGAVELDPKPRLRMIEEIINECDEKVLVFVPFIHAVSMVSEFLAEQKITSEYITGDVAPSKRTEIFYRFKQEVEPKVLVAHPKTMSHGLTLTEASVVVWVSPPGFEVYEQANGRITRPGQTQKQLIVHLQSTPLEAAAYNRLKNQESQQNLLLEMFEGG